MPTTTNVQQVKVNLMTEAQYSSATKNPNEFYAVTDAQLSYNDLANKPTIPTQASDIGAVAANTAITGATKCKITYDSKGLVTSGADLASGDITTALGYTPYNSTNPSGYITGITSSDVTTALGYTPYNSSNPNGYTSNVGTVTSVNNVNPVNGNVTISIPSEVTETTVSNWGFTKNTGTVTSVNNVSPVSGNVTLSIPTVNDSTISFTQGGVSKGSFTLNQASGATIALDAGGGSSYTAGTGIDITNNEISVTSPVLVNNTSHGLSILGTTSNTNSTTSIGKYADATGLGSIAISDSYGSATASGAYGTCVGGDSSATGTGSTAFGSHAKSTATYAVQLGYGTNSEANSFYVATSTSNNWKLLGSDGKVPDGRLPIATSVSSSSTNADVVGAKLFYDTCGDIVTLINAL